MPELAPEDLEVQRRLVGVEGRAGASRPDPKRPGVRRPRIVLFFLTFP